jgi:molybdenum cofactor cytidylyltransferase
MKIAHLILSAGGSSRMGSPKGLLVWRGKTLLQHAAEAAHGSGSDLTFAILGGHFLEMNKEALRLGLNSIENKGWESGMGSSIKRGVNAVIKSNLQCNGILIQLLDQPLVTAKLLRGLKNSFDENKIVAAQYGGTLGAPVLFSGRYFQVLQNISDNMGAKKIIFSHQKDVVKFDLPEGTVDVDTPEEFQNLG